MGDLGDRRRILQSPTASLGRALLVPLPHWQNIIFPCPKDAVSTQPFRNVQVSAALVMRAV